MDSCLPPVSSEDIAELVEVKERAQMVGALADCLRLAMCRWAVRTEAAPKSLAVYPATLYLSLEAKATTLE
jgi:hypothetical protein